jgi:hypothetical protein
MRRPFSPQAVEMGQVISKIAKDQGGDLLRGNGLSNLLETLR